jgi:UDP-glucose 4-epimerase
MKKGLIFGSNGYLARNLTSVLLKDNFILELSDIHEKSFDNYSFYKKTDVTINDDIKSFDFNVDYIFIFSGLTGTSIGFEKYKEFISVNEIGTINILNHIRTTSSKAKIIFPSSRLVYKGIKDKLLSEDNEKDSKTVYALNKLFGENILKIYSNLFGIDFTIFRICVPYGNLVDNNYSYGTVGNFFKVAQLGENLKIFGDGDSKRTFSHISDITNIINKTIKLKDSINEIYNIGGDTYSIKDTATLIAKKFKIDIEYIPWPEIDYKIESGDTIFNSEKIDKLLDYNYTFHFKDWLSDLKF